MQPFLPYLHQTNMKQIAIILSAAPLLLFSCKKKEEKFAFYNELDRMGIWVQETLNDTLDFISSSQFIRKQGFGYAQTYFYRIEDDNFVITAIDSSAETTHKIKRPKANEVTLEDINVTAGTADGSGTFIKK